MSKRVLLAIPLLAAMAGGTALGWQWWSLWRFEQNTDDAYVQSDITPISSKVTGHVVAVEVRDNQPVRKGEVLLRIDPRDLQARQAEAEAIIEARRASIANLETRLAAQQALVAQSEAEIGSAEAERKRSRQDLDRASSLVADQWVSRQRFDTSQADAS
ncbi:MAG: biotin/lipoyl-binding protein, partial [Rhodospirillales bacterium]|nr:biotin/lipoyl-binding protein [Rhodospirillales bacterium]